MKPKKLKFPFSWEERKPAFHEGVFIVPQFYEEHKWDGELFNKEFSIEYCSGNGDWIIEKALQHPDRSWIAVEMQFERVRKIWSKMHNRSVNNLLIVCGEALTFTKYYLPKSSVVQSYVNFPDPWPKDRHAKHRLVQKPFVDELARVMKKSGRATFATDDPPYAQQMIEEMQTNVLWQSEFSSPYYTKEWKNYGESWFKNLWEEKGRDFFYMRFEKL